MGKSFDITLIFSFVPKLVVYFPATLEILVLSLLLSIIIGFIIALSRIYRVPVLSQIAVVFLSYVRGVPIIVQLFLMYFGLPEILDKVGIDTTRTNVMCFVVITYGLYMGAIFSENIRASVGSVSKGQIEAAYSIGMKPLIAFKRIILPQAVIVMLPNFANMVIGGLKDTSLAFSVGMMEVMSRGKILGATTNHFFEVYISLAAIYYVAYLFISKLFKLAEKRVSRHKAALPSAT